MCFVIGFYHLVERCCCVLSEWSLALWFCRSQLYLFFFFFFKGWGHVNRTAVKIFPLQMFTSTFLSGIQPFYLWACYPTANNRVNSTSYVSDSPPVPIQPPQLKPMIMLDAFCVMLGLEMGQLKDKLLLNQSLTPLRTNRAVERV